MKPQPKTARECVCFCKHLIFILEGILTAALQQNTQTNTNSNFYTCNSPEHARSPVKGSHLNHCSTNLTGCPPPGTFEETFPAQVTRLNGICRPRQRRDTGFNFYSVKPQAKRAPPWMSLSVKNHLTWVMTARAWGTSKKQCCSNRHQPGPGPPASAAR